ncbi:hypothetical protein PF005_g24928 [Phytophthora fragariae]|uniref:Uncharacterized protein n=1 Tax=Phytophthora fragariae TaxID=53985 RepID=A0A6A3W4V9_9STRA|nr:hypothetical protein PF010_g23586 [Phytophthora fragariae]KAE9077819.1 hypothetical protein PF007_g24102 [Phytophthora fragariae]KAE9176490.1 hypothetical protein PF005_g24928 [Phytophthora fragariae]KAE9189264.1 hypothetical protein PF002_g25098 [Phytophthora fragariae]KAE9282538.1 hypothetical protein PF001_g23262 [Phytophthora fragariae]
MAPPSASPPSSPSPPPAQPSVPASQHQELPARLSTATADDPTLALTPSEPEAAIPAGEGEVSASATNSTTPRSSKRIMKRKADVAARSVERKKKLTRLTPATLDELLGATTSTATPRLDAAPPRTKAAGKQKLGTAARAAKAARTLSSKRSAAASGAERAGITEPNRQPVSTGNSKRAHHHERHSIIYLDSPPSPSQGDGAATAPPPANTTAGTSLSMPPAVGPPSAHAALSGPLGHEGMDTFDLASFLTAPQPSIAPLPASTEVGPASDGALGSLLAQVGSLNALVLDMSRRLDAAETTAPDLSAPPRGGVPQPILANSPQRNSWTLPAVGSNALPPVQLRELRSTSFPSSTHRSRGEGLTSIPFDSSIATATGLYGVRIGSQGLSLSHFRPLSDDERLTRSSNNTNFSLDFSTAAQLPQPAKCATYDDILLAISGLSAFGVALWYPHMNHLLDRLRRRPSGGGLAYVVARFLRGHRGHRVQIRGLAPRPTEPPIRLD